MYNLGIVGRGFVGSAVEFGFSPQTGCDVNNMYIYDKDKSREYLYQLFVMRKEASEWELIADHSKKPSKGVIKER